MTPLNIRLALGSAAVVTSDEVRDLLGVSRDRADELLARVRPLAIPGRGREVWVWGHVLSAATTAEAEATRPAPPLPLADVAPRAPRGRLAKAA